MRNSYAVQQRVNQFYIPQNYLADGSQSDEYAYLSEYAYNTMHQDPLYFAGAVAECRRAGRAPGDTNCPPDAWRGLYATLKGHGQQYVSSPNQRVGPVALDVQPSWN